MDIQTLKVKINSKGLCYKKVADALGIDISTFYRKLERSGSTFTIAQATQLTKILDLTEDEVQSIFFTP